MLLADCAEYSGARYRLPANRWYRPGQQFLIRSRTSGQVLLGLIRHELQSLLNIRAAQLLEHPLGEVTAAEFRRRGIYRRHSPEA